MYDWANSAYSLTITSAIFPAFYEQQTSTKNDAGEVISDIVLDKYGIVNTTLYSYAIAAGFLVVALIAPLLSGIADYSDSKKRFMQFFCYLGSIACATLYFFDSANVWVGLVGITLACIGWSGGNIFYNAYLPEIAEPEDHDRISATGYALGYVGSVILLVWNLTMIMFPDFYGIDKVDAAKISFLSVGIWWALFAQYTFRRLPNGDRRGKLNGQILSNGYKEIAKVWQELRKTVRLKRYLIAFFIYNTGVQTTMYMAASFAAKEIKSVDEFGNVSAFETENLIITILLIQLVGIVGAFLFSKLSEKMGNLRALTIAVIAWVVIVAFAYKVEFEHSFYMLACGVGMVMGGVQALSRSTYAKFLPDTDDHASYFSFYNMCYYLGTVLGTFGFGYILTLTGDIRNSILVIGCSFVIGLIVLLTVPKTERSTA